MAFRRPRGVRGLRRRPRRALRMARLGPRSGRQYCIRHVDVFQGSVSPVNASSPGAPSERAAASDVIGPCSTGSALSLSITLKRLTPLPSRMRPHLGWTSLGRRLTAPPYSRAFRRPAGIPRGGQGTPSQRARQGFSEVMIPGYPVRCHRVMYDRVISPDATA
jgi:hypothetical protein